MNYIPLLLIILSTIFITGLINRTRAKFSGRRGFGIFQHLHNVRLLLSKGSVFSETSTYISQVASSVYFAAILTAALFIPFGAFPAVFAFDGDFVMFAYLLALSRLMIILLAWDAGSSFQGMGASREALYGLFAEPALFILLGTLSLATGYDSFSTIFASFDNVSANLIVLSMLVGYAFLNLGIVESCRIPVDDPRTHLELTMIHEVMILDVSGVDLALMQIGSWLKTSLFAILFANAIIPAHWGIALSLVGFLVSQLVFAIAIGTIESMRARHKMPKNAIYITSIGSIALVSFIVAYLLTQNVNIG